MSQGQEKTPVLPRDLVELCVARLPLSRYHMANKICRKIRSFINNGKVFELRSDHKLTATSIHLLLKSTDGSSKKRWYVLEKTKTEKNKYELSGVPFPFITRDETGLVGAGSSIYAIGLLEDYGSSNFFSVLCGSYKQRQVPPMKASRYMPKAAVINGVIYVFGGCATSNQNFLEVFDQARNSWETIDMPEQNRTVPLLCQTVVLSGKILFIHNRGTHCTAFDPKTGILERKDEYAMGEKMYDTSCVINDRLFAFGTSCKIEYFNAKVRTWTVVKGLPDFDILNSGLFNLNGKILVIKQQTPEEISFTVITLQMRGLEMWGNVESRNIIFQKQPATIEAIVSVET